MKTESIGLPHTSSNTVVAITDEFGRLIAMFGLPSLTASIAGERILWNGPTLRGAIDAKRNSLHAGTSYGDLCEAELALSKGCLAAAAAKQIRVVEQTFYRWRKEQGWLGGNLNPNLNTGTYREGRSS